MANETIKDRLRQFVESRGLTPVEFQRICKLSNGWLALQSEPNSSALAKILAEFPQLSPDWVILGIGNMTRPLKSHPNVILTDQEPVKDHTPISPSTSPIENINEPVQPYHMQTSQPSMVTIPQSTLDALIQQLENKDAQIATLMTIIGTKNTQ